MSLIKIPLLLLISLGILAFVLEPTVSSLEARRYDRSSSFRSWHNRDRDWRDRDHWGGRNYYYRNPYNYGYYPYYNSYSYPYYNSYSYPYYYSPYNYYYPYNYYSPYNNYYYPRSYSPYYQTPYLEYYFYW